MEYGLWHMKIETYAVTTIVLILVLMEYGLWHKAADGLKEFETYVLILVLMEYGLWRTGWLYADGSY